MNEISERFTLMKLTYRRKGLSFTMSSKRMKSIYYIDKNKIIYKHRLTASLVENSDNDFISVKMEHKIFPTPYDGRLNNNIIKYSNEFYTFYYINYLVTTFGGIFQESYKELCGYSVNDIKQYCLYKKQTVMFIDEYLQFALDFIYNNGHKFDKKYIVGVMDFNNNNINEIDHTKMVKDTINPYLFYFLYDKEKSPYE